MSLVNTVSVRHPAKKCTNYSLYPFTQGLRPLCLPCATTKLARSPLKAEGRPNDCLGRSRVAHRTFRHRHGRHGRRGVLSMFEHVKAHTSPWSHNGCTVVGHWSPSKNANIVYQFERHVCLPCTTIVPPLADQ